MTVCVPSVVKYGGCSNETRLRIVLGEVVESIKNVPHGYLCRYPIDTPANGFPLQRPQGLQLIPLQPWMFYILKFMALGASAFKGPELSTDIQHACRTLRDFTSLQEKVS